jgi:hypothetical protein
MSVARWIDPQSRLDLHNISINFAAASQGRCSFTHLDSGRLPAPAPAPRTLRPAAFKSCARGPGWFKRELEPTVPACWQPFTPGAPPFSTK